MGMDKLARGLERLGLSLTLEQRERFELYYRELVVWNQRANLTTITEYEEVQVKHFLDSLSVALAWEGQPIPHHLIDVGSGAGLPGLPLKILFPQLSLTLLDSVRKKTRFLDHLVDALGLEGVEILTGRAEDLGHEKTYREVFDLVLSRAVAPLPRLVELTLPFCQQGGLTVAQKTSGVEEEMAKAERPLHLLGGRMKETKAVPLEEWLGQRFLVLIEKVSLTPPAYPRRPAAIARRPL